MYFALQGTRKAVSTLSGSFSRFSLNEVMHIDLKKTLLIKITHFLLINSVNKTSAQQ